ncbi:acyltransferase family protein [Lysinibacter cavernae]|uniref:Putative membrane protein YcfT n=1 Tax=Lysinibacter cavernae TaxID=1640652 RepID=A0A7X5QYA1_9MICO|nr:acyltransferase family protein [Lysinibacter cavernae]NIH52152.1 putative membrane protein YcfT [Lysinibacter cavernae]
MTWVDSLRGIAVLLVVSTHSVSLLMGAHLLPNDVATVALEANRLFWPFRMPALMLFSGLFVIRSFQKGIGRYLSGKLRYVAWPYLVWSFLMILRATGWDIAPMLSIIWRPYSSLWFLYYLVAFYVLFLIVTKIPTPLVIAASLVASFLAPSVASLPRFLYLFAFFMAGIWISQHVSATLIILKKPTVIIGAFLIAAPTALAASQNLLPLYDVRVAPLAFAGIALAVGLAQWIPQGRISHLFEYVGRHSLVYYVVHPLALIILTGVLIRSDAEQHALWYPILFATYVMLATLISVASDRSKLVNALFIMPVLSRNGAVADDGKRRKASARLRSKATD